MQQSLYSTVDYEFNEKNSLYVGEHEPLIYIKLTSKLKQST